VVIYSEPNELGTGYDTYLLTCNHVVELPTLEAGKASTKYEAEDIEFFDEHGNSRKVMGRVVAHSPNVVFDLDTNGNFRVKNDKNSGDDLALIKLDALEHFPAAKLISRERYNNLRIMQRVRLVGCSLGDRPIPTSGEITRLEDEWTSSNADMIFGNSGGAAYLEETNELIGITNAIRLVSAFQALPHMGLIRPVNRIYDWLDTIGYGFLYEKDCSDAVRSAVIREESDGAKFADRDYMRALEKQLKDLRIASDKKVKELEKRIAELEDRLDEILCNEEPSPSPSPLPLPPPSILPPKVMIPIK